MHVNNYTHTLLCRVNSYVERLLDRISNGKLAEDRRNAMVELQSVVAESNASQLAFGAMGECFALVCSSGFFVFIFRRVSWNVSFTFVGFPVLMGVLKEERDDVEMVTTLSIFL